MGKLTEKYVQEASLNFLADYYKRKYSLEKIFAKTEVKTTYKKTNGRADGLIAFRTVDNSIYTVSLEAKSHKTFNSLRTIYENKKFFGLGFLFLILSFTIIHTLLLNQGWVIKWIFAFIMSLVLTFGLLILFQYNAWFEKHSVIDQIQKYPANEKWIAISKDAYNYYNKLNDYELVFRAKKYNIGILVVNQRQKVDIIQEAKEATVKNNYLKHYVIAQKIKEVI